MVDSVLEKQFRDYLRFQNVSIGLLNKAQLAQHKTAYAQALYPGSKLPPEKIISQLTSQNPQVTLSSEVLVDKGYDECDNVAGDTPQELSCPKTPGIQWKKLELNKDGSKQILCINTNDRSPHTETTGGTSLLEDYCHHDPHQPYCCSQQQCAPHLWGNTCTGYGANRLRFSLEDSALQEELFELYCEGELGK